MSNTVIKIENVSKQYRLGQVGTGTLTHDLKRWWHLVRGKEDPFLKIGDVNKRDVKGDSEYVWALKDISFDVQRGEVLGIIGKNGAGKSTLLKILSRVTGPTTGEYKVKGRIASLLEVGTGFNPELTGRENVFLNGAILGMTKAEIRNKFDEIVAFSGVERYIDTPVKRYSSGMYVRLAFAVAAHLEPEILIIDEVLAVGDAEFQKKCLGKMKSVAGEGRTVIFVSHNMTAVNTLCTDCIYLKEGKIVSKGNTIEIVNQYLANENTSRTKIEWENGSKPGDEVAVLHSARMIDASFNHITSTTIHQKIGIEFTFEVLKEGYNGFPNIHLLTSKREYVFASGEGKKDNSSKKGMYTAVMWIPENLLNVGTYIAGAAYSSMNPVKIHFFETEAIIFDVIEDINLRNSEYNQHIPGVIRPILDWETKKIN
jgi:lipopolysaccharide transport system ATP-binding protein